MLDHLRHNWLPPLAIAVAFTLMSILVAGFDLGRTITIFIGLFFLNSLVGLVVYLLVGRSSDSSR